MRSGRISLFRLADAAALRNTKPRVRSQYEALLSSIVSPIDCRYVDSVSVPM